MQVYISRIGDYARVDSFFPMRQFADRSRSEKNYQIDRFPFLSPKRHSFSRHSEECLKEVPSVTLKDFRVSAFSIYFLNNPRCIVRSNFSTGIKSCFSSAIT